MLWLRLMGWFYLIICYFNFLKVFVLFYVDEDVEFGKKRIFILKLLVCDSVGDFYFA